jgi:hypothetical protein
MVRISLVVMSSSVAITGPMPDQIEQFFQMSVGLNELVDLLFDRFLFFESS